MAKRDSFVKVPADMQRVDGDVRATAPLLRALNERAVLDVIRRAAPVSRAEVARQSGISKPTVSSALRALVDAGLVREAAPRPDGPSYGAVFFEPVPDAAIVLGIDIGARYLRAAIADLSGAIRARQDVELHGADAAGVLAVVDEVRGSLLEASRLGEHLVDSAVVGMPGVVGPGDMIGLAGGVIGLGGEGFTQALRDRMAFPVTFENDVNLAAVGEQWGGVAQGVDDFAVLSVGTGTGVGIVLGGELHRGRHGAAGEIDLAYAGLGLDIDPCAAALEAYATRIGRNYPGTTALRRALRHAGSLLGRPRRRRAGDAGGRGGGTADRGQHRPDRRRRRRLADRARRRHRRERRPAAGAGAHAAADVAALPADARRLEPGRVGGPAGRARPGRAQRARQRLQPPPRTP